MFAGVRKFVRCQDCSHEIEASVSVKKWFCSCGEINYTDLSAKIHDVKSAIGIEGFESFEIGEYS